MEEQKSKIYRVPVPDSMMCVVVREGSLTPISPYQIEAMLQEVGERMQARGEDPIRSAMESEFLENMNNRMVVLGANDLQELTSAVMMTSPVEYAVAQLSGVVASEEGWEVDEDELDGLTLANLLNDLTP